MMKILAKMLTSFMIVSALVMAPVTSADALSVSKADKVLKVAKSLKGTPYKWGGTSKKGFDCSGYTQYVYKKAIGKKLPRVVGAQAAKGKAVSKGSKKKGDLIIFGNYHVGIYAGDGKIWHAPSTGKRVEKVKIWTSGYKVRRL